MTIIFRCYNKETGTFVAKKLDDALRGNPYYISGDIEIDTDVYRPDVVLVDNTSKLKNTILEIATPFSFTIYQNLISTKTKDYKVGDAVKFIGKARHECYPPVGTVGRVVNVYDDSLVLVQWPNNSTCCDDRWYVIPAQIQKVSDSQE